VYCSLHFERHSAPKDVNNRVLCTTLQPLRTPLSSDHESFLLVMKFKTKSSRDVERKVDVYYCTAVGDSYVSQNEKRLIIFSRNKLISINFV
jgi:hypothetical protein